MRQDKNRIITPIAPDLSRRTFLKAGSIAGSSIFAPSIISSSALAQSGVWGDFPIAELSGLQPKKILEIHCYGAPSIWESLWITKDGNTPNYRGFDQEMQEARFLCPADSNNSNELPSANDVEFFATDNLGNEIHLGPAASPIWGLKDKMRYVVQKHPYPEIPIHEAAVPYAITGSRLGSPRFAATGAAISRRQQQLLSGVTTPHAYSIATGTPAAINHLTNASVATGTHPGSARPLLLKIHSPGQLTQRLNRNLPDENDTMLDVLRGQYEDYLRFNLNPTSRVRSRQLDSYHAAIESTYRASDLTSILTDNLLAIEDVAYCVKQSGAGDPPDKDNPVGSAINLARDLLTRNVGGAKHVLVADTGLEKIDNNIQPCYDTHRSLITDSFEMVRATTANLYNMFSALADAIDPTGQDPNKINLEQTMIVINMEFGRTPSPSGSDATRKGREHFETGGYIGILLGDQIAGGAIAGAMQNAVGNAGVDGHPPNDNSWYSPTDFKMAVLLAAGIWPFAEGNFGTTESGPAIFAGGEKENAIKIATDILGIDLS